MFLFYIKMGSTFATFDVEAFAQETVQHYQGKRLLIPDLAKILSRVPKRYREQVAGRLLELHKSHI
jgi:hypothetical protein